MALHLHRAERTDLLADGLGALLAKPLPDPFAEELVLVPARGVERWLSQRLSHVLGTGHARRRGLRGGRVPQPGLADRRDHRHGRRRPLVTRRHDVAAAGGDRRQPRRAVVPHPRNSPRPLRNRRGAGAAPGRRYAVARRLAGLFASYARQRPQLLVDWRKAISPVTSTPTCPGSLICGARWSSASTPIPRTSGTPETLARLRESPTDLPAAAVTVRPHPAAVHRDRAPGRAGHPPRPSPLAAPPQR